LECNMLICRAPSRLTLPSNAYFAAKLAISVLP
jgi:hypothetical protein